MCATWEKVRSEHAHYTDETLSKDTLHDDYQVLFVNIVLEHVQHVIESVRAGTQPNPLRLLLLGTAGSGKTRSIQTVLQEIQRTLRDAQLPASISEREFVRVGAPTGSAAFNLRFEATTIHRLIHWYTPPFFRELTNTDALAKLQRHLQNAHLLLLDEVSMIGRQMMGRID